MATRLSTLTMLVTPFLGLLSAGQVSAQIPDYISTSVSEVVNCRAQADINSPREGQFPPHHFMSVLGEKGQWFKVQCPNGQIGFISKLYSQAVTDAPLPLPGFDLPPLFPAPAPAPRLSPVPRVSPSRPSQNQPSRLACPSASTRRTSKVTYYFAPTLKSYDSRKCNMEGTCFFKRNGVDMIYNSGMGSRPISQAKCPYGWGSKGNCLNPCTTVAADPRYHRVGEVLFFPRLRGQICRGKVHDGYVTVGDVGSAIKGADRFDFYWGNCSAPRRGDVCADGGAQWGSPDQIQRVLTHTNYCSIARRKNNFANSETSTSKSLPVNSAR